RFTARCIDEAPMSRPSSATLLKSALLILLLFGVAAAAVFWIFSTEPEAQHSGALKKTAMLVEVTPAEQGTFRPEIVVTGTVRAEKEVSMSPQVSGAVVSRREAFSPGKFVSKGTVLLQIDPAGYRLALAQQKSALAQVKTRLRLEEGNQDLAQQEHHALFSDTTLSAEEKALVLRTPQLAAVREEVATAETAVRQAQLDLASTTFTAPFDAQVIERNVDVGAFVQPGMTLGRLVGVERYWVEAAVPLTQRQWLSFADDKTPKEGEEPCSEVILQNRAGWPEGATRRGCLARLIGALDESTRLARVLVEVDDPLSRKDDAPKDAPPLMIGEFLETRIIARPLKDVVRIPRKYVRKGNTAWLARGELLAVVDLEIALFDADYAYVRSGVVGGDLIVTTDLSRVKEGAPLRFEASDSSQEKAGASGE